MKKILITGAAGFVGSHLIDYLLSSTGDSIIGTYRGEKPAGEGERLQFCKVDFSDREAVDTLLQENRPDHIYHLAAQSNVPQSIKNPIETFHTNIDTLLNILLSIKEHEMFSTRFLLVSSAEVYGQITQEDLPVDEQTPHRPANPYAVSKITQDYLGYQFSLSYKLDIVRVRPFNHIGPRQKSTFVTSDFAKQIAEIEKGENDPIMKVGNLEAKRDFTDVRDMVELYTQLMEKGKSGDVYNAGSGKAIAVQTILDTLISKSDKKIQVQHDPERMRPSDIPELVADTTKVRNLTGWEPKIPLEKTLEDILDYWREIV